MESRASRRHQTVAPVGLVAASHGCRRSGDSGGRGLASGSAQLGTGDGLTRSARGDHEIQAQQRQRAGQARQRKLGSRPVEPKVGEDAAQGQVDTACEQDKSRDPANPAAPSLRVTPASYFGLAAWFGRRRLRGASWVHGRVVVQSRGRPRRCGDRSANFCQSRLFGALRTRRPIGTKFFGFTGVGYVVDGRCVSLTPGRSSAKTQRRFERPTCQPRG